MILVVTMKGGEPEAHDVAGVQEASRIVDKVGSMLDYATLYDDDNTPVLGYRWSEHGQERYEVEMR